MAEISEKETILVRVKYQNDLRFIVLSETDLRATAFAYRGKYNCEFLSKQNQFNSVFYLQHLVHLNLF